MTHKNYLLIDAGNSFCKLALYSQDTNTIRPLKYLEYAPWEQMSGLFKNLLLQHQVNSLVMSNVNHRELEQGLEQLIKNTPEIQFYSIKPPQITHAKLQSEYLNLKQLGCDRWLAMLAMCYQYPSFCVVDCGTAITIDFVENSIHKGGFIAPGLNTGYQALNKNTANLPFINNRDKQQDDLDSGVFLGKTTQDCIKLGVINQAIGLIDYSVSQQMVMMAESEKGDFPVFITGGDKNIIEQYIQMHAHSVQQNSYQFEENLVLKGLLTLIEQNILPTQHDTQEHGQIQSGDKTKGKAK